MDSVCEAIIKIEIPLDDDAERNDERVDRVLGEIQSIEEIEVFKVQDIYSW